MAQIRVFADELTDQLDSPTLVEGLPGVGLVGKIAADHLVEVFDMTHYGDVYCGGVPKVAVYMEGSPTLHPPVRLYADAEHDLLVLQSDIPIRPESATELATCLDSWIADLDVTPIYLSGIARQKSDGVPALYGVGSDGVLDRLEEAGIGLPTETGLISGPTGAMLNYSVQRGTPAFGLIVESDPQFPDPEAARIIIKQGIEPLTGIEVPVDDLVDSAAEIRQAKENLAKQMQQADEESSQARPLGMYQ
ncbi:MULTISPECIES: proteasome assembly chaperone family protein [Haloferax]|uniref:Proteasome assembly chaperone family protein n=1 Tax=Haloferax marinum TaxID=2666143 RepID=A0A6A8G2A8_9EURY|nr:MULTISPECIES: PAC2 family protein [Haloferax]KAB1196193.1 proteasome assembly chaperone family protein [Haloferax sp. CBA1150]MRW95181.1 proteasome assembly chaperone family protein [Haloferax marinum]